MPLRSSQLPFCLYWCYTYWRCSYIHSDFWSMLDIIGRRKYANTYMYKIPYMYRSRRQSFCMGQKYLYLNDHKLGSIFKPNSRLMAKRNLHNWKAAEKGKKKGKDFPCKVPM